MIDPTKRKLTPYEKEVKKHMDEYLEANKWRLCVWHEAEIASIVEAAKRHVARTKWENSSHV